MTSEEEEVGPIVVKKESERNGVTQTKLKDETLIHHLSN